MRTFIIISFITCWSSVNVIAQLTNSGNIRTFSGANVTIYGDLTNNGSIVDSGLLVTLAGSNPQAVGGSSITTLNNLTLNNSSASGVTLNRTLNVRGLLTFSDGYLNTSPASLLSMTATSSVTGASNNSFVFGPVMKTGNSAFVFPTGKNVVYAPIAIAAPSVITDQFTAEYFQASPNPLYSVWSLETGIDHVSQCEYWMLDRTTGTSNVAVTLSWENGRSCGVNDPPDLLVVRWDGTQWTNKGNGGTTGTAAMGTVVSSAPVTGFGPFTLGSSTGDNALPVELLAFSAQCEEEKVVLRWATESEFDNAYFTIQSSMDGIEWKNAAQVAGSGTTVVPTNYSWTDISNPGRDMYYRLSQTDNNGTVTTHTIVYLKNCISGPENDVSIYPNPTGSLVNILTEEKILEISVTNAEGKVVNVAYDSDYRQLDFSTMPVGVYILRVTTLPGTYIKKLTVLRD
jgi:hypothetical protein